MTALMSIEVCYALPGEQVIEVVLLEVGSTVSDALKASKLLARFPGLDLSKNHVGIFGKQTKLEAVLREGDRVEIYRALIADPKEERRKRAGGKTK